MHDQRPTYQGRPLPRPHEEIVDQGLGSTSHSIDREVTEEVAMVTHNRDVDAIARALADWLPHPLGAKGEVVDDVHVPALLGIEESYRPMGASLVVTEHVPGRVPLDNPPYVFCGWLYEATPAQRRIVQDATLDVLGRTHAITAPPRQFPRFTARGSDPLRHHVDQAWAHYQWTRRDDVVAP